MSFFDLGCQGNKIPTPNLDATAKDRQCFTQFHNTARCAPSRASLPTGLYPHEAGVGYVAGNQSAPCYRGRLNDDSMTAAKVLKLAGTFSALSGKWHVGE